MTDFTTSKLHRGRDVLDRVRAFILLGGSVRRGCFAAATGRSLLDLPVEQNWSVLQHWQKEVAELVHRLDMDRVPLRLLLDPTTRAPIIPAPLSGVDLRVERDPRPYRGTAGLLRDCCQDYADDDYVIVASGGQILSEPLVETMTSMASTGGDLCVVSHPDGTPSGLMLLRVACLRVVPDRGFFDMKEQALPLIARDYRGSVVYRERPVGLPVKTLSAYIHALSVYHRRRDGVDLAHDPFAEDWNSAFSIVEQGAAVDSNVRLHNSIILEGGHVEDSAFVVRSIVCPRGTVSERSTVVDRLVVTEEHAKN